MRYVVIEDNNFYMYYWGVSKLFLSRLTFSSYNSYNSFKICKPSEPRCETIPHEFRNTIKTTWNWSEFWYQNKIGFLKRKICKIFLSNKEQRWWLNVSWMRKKYVETLYQWMNKKKHRCYWLPVVSVSSHEFIKQWHSLKLDNIIFFHYL